MLLNTLYVSFILVMSLFILKGYTYNAGHINEVAIHNLEANEANDQAKYSLKNINFSDEGNYEVSYENSARGFLKKHINKNKDILLVGAYSTARIVILASIIICCFYLKTYIPKDPYRQ